MLLLILLLLLLLMCMEEERPLAMVVDTGSHGRWLAWRVFYFVHSCSISLQARHLGHFMNENPGCDGILGCHLKSFMYRGLHDLYIYPKIEKSSLLPRNSPILPHDRSRNV